MESSELGDVRHDLKNVMMALRSGCMLIEMRLQPGSEPAVREILADMRAELDKATALLGRPREVERPSSKASAKLAREQGLS